MVYTTYKNGDDWGMVHYCFAHINRDLLILDGIPNQRTAHPSTSQRSSRSCMGTCGNVTEQLAC